VKFVDELRAILDLLGTLRSDGRTARWANYIES
jgi:hypothetical protein